MIRWNVPLWVRSYIEPVFGDIFQIPFLTQILILIPFFILISGFFIPMNLNKNPFLWLFMSFFSASSFLLSFRLISYYYNNAEGDIIFRFIRLYRKFSVIEKKEAIEQSFFSAVDKFCSENVSYIPYKNQFFNEVINLWPKEEILSNISMETAKNLGKGLCDK